MGNYIASSFTLMGDAISHKISKNDHMNNKQPIHSNNLKKLIKNSRNGNWLKKLVIAYSKMKVS